ncbi:MAG: signal peptide peptidase SppA [Terrimicrobiaceae bacterium]
MKKSGCLVAFLFVAVCASLFVNMLLVAALGVKGTASMSHVNVLPSQTFEEETIEEGKGSKDKIAVVPLEGIIAFGMEGSLGDSMVEDFKAALKQAEEDEHVKAVVVAIDSPGGEITASDVLYHALREFEPKKPVVAYFNAIGASGAYYTACGADWIMCNDTTFTGSIGVIISTLNYRELFGKIGLEAVVFKSGKFKDMLNGAREMSPEEKEYVQGLVMQSYDRFLGIVSESRGLDGEKLRSGPADGRILSGTDAFRDKLVDQLGYIEDAYAKARELGKAEGAEVVRYVRSYSFDRFLRLFGETRAAKIEIGLPGKAHALEPGRVYLLPPFFAP